MPAAALMKVPPAPVWRRAFPLRRPTRPMPHSPEQPRQRRSRRTDRRQADRAGPVTARGRGGSRTTHRTARDRGVLSRPACSSGLMARERARPQRPSRPADSDGAAGIAAGRQGTAAPSRPVDSAAGRPAQRPGCTTERCRLRGSIKRTSAPSQPSVATVTKPIDWPVEIVFKPTPEYTDDARSARIEGTVSLELEFTVTGESARCASCAD